MPLKSSKERIAILGGGVGAVTTAFELTNPADWNERYDIDMYIMGWRMGGKGASGRNADLGERIEEHGLHIWMGMYFNAFKAMQRAYVELDRPEGAPLRGIYDAFKPQELVGWEQDMPHGWVHWPVRFPTDDNLPTEGTGFPSPLGMLLKGLERGLEVIEQSTHPRVREILSAHAEGRAPDLSESSSAGGFGSRIKGAIHAAVDAVETGIHAAEDLVTGHRGEDGDAHHGLFHEVMDHLRTADDAGANHAPDSLLHLVGKLMRWRSWWHELLGTIDEADALLHRVVVAIEFCTITPIGMLKDGVFTKGFDVIDQYDFVEWYRRHGATDWLVNSAPIRAVYDMLFAFEKGDTSSLDNRNMAAGVALRGSLRMCVCYNGAIFWKMQAGMGDTVFTPFYEVLKQRGVRVHFFHKVTNLGLSADQRTVDTIEIGVQATVKDGGEYDPLVEVNGLGCWPSRPLYDQLVEGQELRSRRINLESNWTPWEFVAQKTLKLGEDFDKVVLGIPPGSHPFLAPELMAASEEWSTMVDRVKTVQTQALQLWFKPSTEELGWPYGSIILSAYEEPLDTWADMSHLIPRETWPTQGGPRSIAYFCGPMKDADHIPDPSTHGFPASQLERVAMEARRFTDNFAGHLWPDGAPADNPAGLDYNLLFDPLHQEGEPRMRSQFIRANIDPSERYVLSLAGTTQYRLDANKAYFDNVFVAGDWTRTILSAGCVEAAVISGMQCSRAISGFPAQIIGESDFPGDAPIQPEAGTTGEYIWRPNDIVLTGPTAQDDSTVRWFLMPGERAAMQSVVDEVLNKPDLGQDRYAVLSDCWMLAPMEVGRNTCKRPEWRELGWTTETDWAVLVPVVALKQKNGRYRADRLCLFVYDCMVDQPYAMATGRDVWGFPKTMSRRATVDDVETTSTWVLREFAPESELTVMPVMEIKNGTPDTSRRTHKRGSEALEALVHAMTDGKGRVYLPDIELWVNLAEDLLLKQVPMVFLKQMRACNDTDRAVYQAIVEAPCRITHFDTGGLIDGSEVQLHSYASQPLHTDLGVAEGWVKPLLATWIRCNFDLEVASGIWDYAQRQ